MKPTPEMIEAAARALCENQGYDPDGQDSECQSDMGANWKAFAFDAEEALKAALAAMWRPIRSEDRVDDFKALGRGGGCDGVEQVIYNERNGSWDASGYTLEDGKCSEGYSGPEMIIPIAIFEEPNK